MTPETTLIERFVAHFARGGRGLALGPGDDCAVLRPSSGAELCVTTDTVCAGVHFGSRFTPEEIGHKALAVNLSDLAAMGARPRWLLVSLQLPPQARASLVEGLARGMAPLARAHGCTLAGGNVSRASALSLTLTALGEVPAGRALRRDGLRPGDLLGVTGSLGLAALGLRTLRRGRDGREAQRAQLTPIPRVEAGLAARGLACAAIDVSDGLAQDVAQLCRASGCGAELWTACLPFGSQVAGRPDRLALALSGGEDYELLFGVPERLWRRLERRIERTGLPLTLIGRAHAGGKLWVAARPGEKTVPLRARGFSHF